MTRRDRPTRFCRSGAVFLAVLALAGCGGGGGDDGGDDGSRASIIIGDAARKTLEAGTAREHGEFHTEPKRSMDFVTDTIVDFPGDDFKGTFIYNAFEDLEPGTKLDAIHHDDVDYFKFPEEETWTKTETSAQDAIGNSVDMTSALRWFGEVTDDARVDGKETVRGAPTTRYRAILDLQKVAKHVPAGQRLAYSAVVRVFRDPRIPFKIWIDDRSGLIRRMENDVSFANLKAPAPEGEDRLVGFAEWYDFGVEARVEAPPPELTEEE